VNVWHYDTDIETRTVDTHVRRLREKLGASARMIETVRGIGYRVVKI
jgi:two-component system phosphate regulon response regulator PhoB